MSAPGGTERYQVRHEPLMSPSGKESQEPPGLYYKDRCQQAEGDDLYPLHSPIETHLEVYDQFWTFLL